MTGYQESPFIIRAAGTMFAIIFLLLFVASIPLVFWGVLFVPLLGLFGFFLSFFIKKGNKHITSLGLAIFLILFLLLLTQSYIEFRLGMHLPVYHGISVFQWLVIISFSAEIVLLWLSLRLLNRQPEFIQSHTPKIGLFVLSLIGIGLIVLSTVLNPYIHEYIRHDYADYKIYAEIERNIRKNPEGITVLYLDGTGKSISSPRIRNLFFERISKFNNLRELNIGGLKLTSFPVGIGELSSLETLNIAGNQITSVPNEIGKLENLKTIVITDNPLSNAEIMQIQQMLPHTEVIY
ncbi:MAG: hypothetical protein Q8P86_03890 [bacterium]|nr:hypothetical protein [bacterium]